MLRSSCCPLLLFHGLSLNVISNVIHQTLSTLSTYLYGRVRHLIRSQDSNQRNLKYPCRAS